jgi:hypothetical protein
MDGMLFLMVLAVCGIFGAISGAVATTRGHGFLPFFFLGALISPVLAIILAFVIAPPRKAKKRRGRMVRRKVPLYGRGKIPSREDRNPYSSPTGSYRR